MAADPRPGKTFSIDLKGWRRVSSVIAVVVLLTASMWSGTALPAAASPLGTAAVTAPAGWAAVTTYDDHTCGLTTDGTVACWGVNTSGQASAPPGTFSQVSTGGYHTCGVETDAQLVCWGNNGSGRASPPPGTYSQVAAGGWHTCALRTDATVVCFGLNNDGVTNAPSGTFSQISASDNHSCGVRTDGTLACWGQDWFGQSTPPAGTFSQVSAGFSHTCGLRTDGTVACWGRNDSGGTNAPTGVFTQVSAGGYHTCALATDGTVACWGANWAGQANPPVDTFSQLAASIDYTCGVTLTAAITCWGENTSGQGTAPSPQAIDFTSAPPTAAVAGGPSYAAAATASSGLSVGFSVDAASAGVCTVSGATVSFIGVGTCLLYADQPGNASYVGAPQVSQSVSVGMGPQNIIFTSTPPAAPVVGDSYTATATGGGSGNPVVFSATSSACSVTGAGIVTFTGVGACVIAADQAGNDNYVAAAQGQQAFTVGQAPQQIDFTSAPPTGAVVGDSYGVTATGGASGNAVVFSLDGSSAAVCTMSGSTVSFVGPGTCSILADQAGNANYLAATQQQQAVTVGKATQTIAFTSTPPTAAVVGDSYIATATGASGNPIVFSAGASSTAGACTVSADGTVSFTGAETCVVAADQAGNDNYLDAPQIVQSVPVGKATQAIVFTSTAPTAAVVGDSYTATATGGASGSSVVFSPDATSTVDACTVSAAGIVNFTGTGTCVIAADQAGNDNYLAAPQIVQSVPVGKATQAIVFTSTAPTAAVVGDGYTATATGGASANALTFSAAATSTVDACTVSAAGIVNFTGTGTCVIAADQTGNTNYLAATQAEQSVTVGKASQHINFTSTPPVAPIVGDSYTATATGGASGNPVVFSTGPSSTIGACTVAGTGTVSFTGTGACVIAADQTGNTNYLAATQQQQSVPVGQVAQAVVFTSTPPTAAVVGDSYTVTATGGGSGNPVLFSTDVSSTIGACTVSAAGIVSFTGVGSCVIAADQAANDSYFAAAQAHQSMTVATAPVAPAFTAVSPSATGTTGIPFDPYTFTATGNPVPAFALATGSLPSGLLLDTAGALSGTPSEAGTFTFSVRASNGVHPDAISAPVTITISSPFTPLPSVRVWDSRNGPGPIGRIDADQTRDITVTGVGGVPATGITAVALNLTATNPTAATYITVWPTGEPKPPTSNLNIPAGDTRANLVIVKIGTAGKVSFSINAGTIDLIADVAGYYGASSDFTTMSAARVWDSRNGPGPIGRIDADQTRDITVTGVGGVPATGITAVALNLTATNPTAATYITVWPTGEPKPPTSNLNIPAGDTRANLVIVKIGTAGKVSFSINAGTIDLIADVAGYYGASSDFTTMSAARVWDSRNGPGPIGRIDADQTRDITVTGVGGVPATGITAVALNLTATNPTAATYITVWPTGEPKPPTSNLNIPAGDTRANLVIVKIGTAGKVSFSINAGTIDLIADVAGYYLPQPA